MEGETDDAQQAAEFVKPPDRDPATVDRKAEHFRGCRTAREHTPALRERWPAAFPRDDRKVRPLANVVDPVAEAMGWTGSFTHGVLKGWKSSAAYCRAILRDKERINLDGTPSGEMVDDEARKLAAARLVEIKERREKRERAAVTAPVDQVPKPPPPPPWPPPPPPPMVVLETPEQIRAHLRASLLKRRDAPQGADAAP